MKRTLKMISLVSLCFILVGIALGICGWLTGGTLSFAYIPEEHKFITDTEETFTVKEEALETFSDIDIHVDYVDVNILTGDEFSISYPDTEYNKVVFHVENDKLTVSTDATHQISFLSFGAMNTQKKIVTITVPYDTELNQITYKNDLGDCKIKDITFHDLVFQTDCGDLLIENITGNSIDLKSANGDCKMTDSSIDELTYDGNLGNLDVDKFTCKNANLTLDSGDCTMTAATIDKLNANIDLGDITLSLLGNKEDYTINLDVDLGDIKIDGEKHGEGYTYDGAKEKSIEITSDSGDIELEFK